MTELHDLFAWQQRAALAAGDVSPTELTEHYLARIAERNAGLGALVEVTAASALARARALQATGDDGSALWGLPLADKDLSSRAGVPTRYGSRAFEDFVPVTSDPIVLALDRAGAVSLGKTATPEFGMVGYTESTLHGATLNPWNTSTGPGGSSGGAAVAVAAGLLPFAPGSDGGGSTRIPAAGTGLVGVKPSRGLVPSMSAVNAVGGLSVAGTLSRSVRDAALLLSALVESDQPFPYTLRSPGRSADLISAADRPEGRFRIGFNTDTPWTSAYRIELDPEVEAAFTLAQQELAALGHDLDQVDLPPDPSYPEAFMTLWRASASATSVPPEREHLLEPFTRWLRTDAIGLEARALLQAVAALSRFEKATIEAYAPFDAVLTPVLAMTPRPIGWHDENDMARNFEQQCQYAPFTSYVNVSGLPAISVPIMLTEHGVPVAAQLIGRPGGEATLLRIAAQLEDRLHWADRHPEGW